MASLKMYRHYLAMTLALDDMLGGLLEYLDRTGKADNTLVIFTSDHGTQAGAHGIEPWAKKMPYEESIRVPWIMRYPGVLDGGATRDALTAPVDVLPSLCGLCGIHVPRTVEGHDLSSAWRGLSPAFEQDAVLTMNFGLLYDWIADGEEWRGVRTKRYAYCKWLDGRVELFDLEADPLQLENLAHREDMRSVRMPLDHTLGRLMARCSDQLVPGSTYENWFDNYRRVVRNAYGPLGDPEAPPDWSLLA
jgi:arylsulfatase A-like enzyme